MIANLVSRLHHRGIDLAPTWVIRCAKCGNARPLAEVGGIRLGAASTGKRTLGYCSSCRRFRFLEITQDGQDEARHEQFIEELASYVSEGSISVDLAEQIAGADAPDRRKRFIAAHAAEGRISEDEAVRLLGIATANCR